MNGDRLLAIGCARRWPTWWTTASSTRHGLGLGLSLVRASVEAQGGRVTVDSLPGHGSAFTVHLPA